MATLKSEASLGTEDINFPTINYSLFIYFIVNNLSITFSGWRSMRWRSATARGGGASRAGEARRRWSWRGRFGRQQAEAVGGGGGGVGGGGEAEAADESEEDVNLVFGGETEEDGMLLAELDLFPPFFFAMGR